MADADLYEPDTPYANISLLVEYLAARAQADDWAELPAVFQAMEELLQTAGEPVENLLTTGFLEELQRDFEEFDPALERLRQFVQGSRTAAAWQCAWDYRHPEDRAGPRPVT